MAENDARKSGFPADTAEAELAEAMADLLEPGEALVVVSESEDGRAETPDEEPWAKIARMNGTSRRSGPPHGAEWERTKGEAHARMILGAGILPPKFMMETGDE